MYNICVHGDIHCDLWVIDEAKYRQVLHQRKWLLCPVALPGPWTREFSVCLVLGRRKLILN